MKCSKTSPRHDVVSVKQTAILDSALITVYGLSMCARDIMCHSFVHM